MIGAMTENEIRTLIRAGALMVLIIILAFAYGCHECEQTVREAMKQGYINDRGEWRKL